MERQIKKIRKSIEWGIYARESGSTWVFLMCVNQKNFLNFNTHTHKNHFPLSLSHAHTRRKSYSLSVPILRPCNCKRVIHSSTQHREAFIATTINISSSLLVNPKTLHHPQEKILISDLLTHHFFSPNGPSKSF